jgi:hypothetical protein
MQRSASLARVVRADYEHATGDMSISAFQQDLAILAGPLQSRQRCLDNKITMQVYRWRTQATNKFCPMTTAQLPVWLASDS